MIDDAALAALVADELPEQRWFGAKDRGIAKVVTVDHEPLDGCQPEVHWVAATVELTDGGVEAYQLIAAAGEDDRLHDVALDPAVGQRLLVLVAPGERAERVRPLLAEQTNTSLVYDERLILKLFRRLRLGPNPDIDMTLAVLDAGFARVPPVVARWQRDGVDRAVVQRYIAGAVDGWALALTSLRAQLSEDATAPGIAVGDMAADCARLGTVTGELHLALARAYRRQPPDTAAWMAVMSRQLERVHHPAVDRGRVEAVINAVGRVRDAGAAIRVHGDYHLGQVLRSDSGWFVLDFEGEPARPLEERTAFTSPLKDVAGMLRSLQYASLAAMAHGDGDAQRAAARAWEARNRGAFLDAYREAVAHHDLVPGDDGDFATVLSAFELDKALYEIAYEAAHRPDWVSIPLDGVRRLLEAA